LRFIFDNVITVSTLPVIPDVPATLLKGSFLSLVFVVLY